MSNRRIFSEQELKQVRQEAEQRRARKMARQNEWRKLQMQERPDEVRAKNAANMRAWRAANRERARQLSREGSARYVEANPSTRRKSARDYNAKRRAELMAFFGGVCVRCGFTDFRALHLDHIHGGGGQIRAKGGHGLYEKWKMTRDDPSLARETFQLLCANCNNIKRFEDYEYAPKARLRKAAGL